MKITEPVKKILQSGNLMKVQTLPIGKYMLDARSDEGRNMLHIALYADKPHYETILLLVGYGVDVNDNQNYLILCFVPHK